MQYVIKDKRGQRFGKLLVLAMDHDKYETLKKVYWICECDCGRLTSVYTGDLRTNRPGACGCQQNKIKHGLCGTRIHRIHSQMIDRCTNPRNTRYHYYGGRGITVCDEWLESVTAFHRDMGDPPDGMSLDRINVNGSYCKENCRWATQKQQMRNTTRSKMLTVDGVTKPMVEWAETAGAQDYFVIRSRVRVCSDHKLCVFGTEAEYKNRVVSTEELG